MTETMPRRHLTERALDPMLIFLSEVMQAPVLPLRTSPVTAHLPTIWAAQARPMFRGRRVKPSITIANDQFKRIC